MNIGYNRASDPTRYGAVILAAGLSSRMKEFKPLLHVDGQPAVAGLTETLHSAGIRDIVLVTGHRREELQEEIDRLRLTEAYNENYEEGMFTSIQTGLAKAGESFPDKQGVFLIPVDCPLITIRVLRELMIAADGAQKENVAGGARGADAADGWYFVPTFEGKKGHPLLIVAEHIPEILEHDGEGGLKAVTERHWEKMVRVPVPDEEILLDMDTPEGYEAIRQFVAHGFKREKLDVLSARKRIILVRHGQTRQHEEPMFIGQYDVPLSEEGRQQAHALGEQVVELIREDVRAERTWVEGISLGKQPLPAIERIYSSDLSRASETASIIAEHINSAYGPGASFFGEPAGALEDSVGETNVMNAMVGAPSFPGASDAKPIHVEVQPLEGLREIALGDWDGQPVSRIREEHPQEYARRGEDLFTFKTGNRGENFYDMQYRAVAALREILADDYARNIIIVAHSGVIRALENNLKGLRVDDEWEPLDKGDLRIWVPTRDVR